MSIEKLPRYSLIDTLVERVEGAIARGDYPVDTKLPGEEELALQFAVSRPVVREALARLRERGAVDTINGKGTFVRHPDINDVSQSMLRQLRPHMGRDYSVEDLYQVRRLIEVEAAGLAAQHAEPDDLARLDAHLHAMRVSAGKDLAGYTAADTGFHIQIAQSTHNALFPILLAPLVDIIVQGMYRSVQTAHEGMNSGVDEHTRILDRLRARDTAGARLAMEQHLTRSKQKFPVGD